MSFLQNYKKYILIFILLLISFLVGKYSSPEKILEVEKIVYKEKIIKELVYTDKSKISKTKITKPDGTIEETEQINNDISVLDTSITSIESQKDTLKLKENSPRFFAGPMLINSQLGGGGIVKITNNIMIGAGYAPNNYTATIMVGF